MFGFLKNLDERFSLKYPENVPEGYGISEMQFTFDFICLVLVKDSSIDGAIRSVAEEYGLSQSFVKDYLIGNKYILNKASKDEISNQLKDYNTKNLKRILKSNGLKTSGKREKIEQRILDNNLLTSNYSLSSKSKVFYKNKKRRVNIFNEYLSCYYFDEFNDYYMDNFRKKENRIPIDFVDIHIEKATEDENHRMYVLNCYAMAKIFCEMGNYKKMMEYVLKIYCIVLNPEWRTDDLASHGGVPAEVVNLLHFLKDKLGRNRIISAYFVVWDSFNFERIIVSKYAGYRYLKDMLNYKDYLKINEELTSRYYSNENLKIRKITQKTLFDF